MPTYQLRFKHLLHKKVCEAILDAIAERESNPDFIASSKDYDSESTETIVQWYFKRMAQSMRDIPNPLDFLPEEIVRMKDIT